MFGASGCNEAERNRSHLLQIEGVWEWVESINVETKQKHTPVTEGFNAQLTFRPDDETSGTYAYSKDDRLIVEGQYGIGFEDAHGPAFITFDKGFDFLSETAWLALSEEVLVLDGVFELGYESTYSKAGRD